MKANATDTAISTLQERRTALQRSIQDWYGVQNAYMPAALTQRSSRLADDNKGLEGSTHAEDMPILMPSDIGDPGLRNAGCVGTVIDKERQYATARMKDSLVNVRRFLCIKAAVIQKMKHSMAGMEIRIVFIPCSPMSRPKRRHMFPNAPCFGDEEAPAIRQRIPNIIRGRQGPGSHR